MNKLETLLNSLIKIGWKPWNVDVNCNISIKIENNRIKIYFELKTGVIVSNSGGMSIRELVSLESGLWQFCMENGLCKGDIYERIKADLQILGAGESHQSDRDYQYRLLESSLIPEEELEKFLLDNIVAEGKKE